MEKHYFITGVNGFLGRTLARRLLENGHHVSGLRLPGDKFSLIEGVDYYLGDVSKVYTLVKFMRSAAEKEAVVIHCAGLVSVQEDADRLWKVNVDGTRNIVDLCEKHQIPKLIYVSSVHALPEGEKGETIKETNCFSASRARGAYGKSKAEATAYVKKAAERGLPAAIVHPSGLIGPGDYSGGYMTELIRFYIKHPLPVAVTGGYDFVDVRDVAEGIIRCAETGAAGQSYILSNEYVSIRRMFELLSKMTGNRKPWGSLPVAWLKSFGEVCGRTAQWLELPGLITPYSLETLESNGNFSHEKAEHELGYRTRPLEETLADTIQWIKEETERTA